MKKLTLFFAVLFVFGLSDGAFLSSGNVEINPAQFSALNNIFPQDLNLTEFSLALSADHPHAHLNVTQVIELYGYTAEIHTVITKDEYILELHRITGNKKNPKAAGKPAILLQHGLLCSSMDWVIAGPERGFGFILADAGYDVWLGNVRGSKYSRNHKRWTVDDKRYWAFDWHEIGIHDIPTMIDHILKVTGRPKIYYAGHSQGSTTFFVMASELPEYNDKIHVMFSLAPVAYSSRMFSPIFQFFSKIIFPINLLTNLIGVYEFKPSDSFFQKFSSIICDDGSILQPLCLNVIFMITGFNAEQFDTSLLPAILAHVPAGAGTNQFVHYAQIINSGHFRQFDYGVIGNLQRYHSIWPPAYDIKNIKAPVSLHYSINDWLSNPADVEKLYGKLPTRVGRFRVPNNKFNHLDFLWAKDVKRLLYSKILTIMKRYKD